MRVEVLRYPGGYPGRDAMAALIVKLKVLGLYKPRSGYEAKVQHLLSEIPRAFRKELADFWYADMLDLLQLRNTHGEERPFYDTSTGQWTEVWVLFDVTRDEYAIMKRVAN